MNGDGTRSSPQQLDVERDRTKTTNILSATRSVRLEVSTSDGDPLPVESIQKIQVVACAHEQGCPIDKFITYLNVLFCKGSHFKRRF